MLLGRRLLVSAECEDTAIAFEMQRRVLICGDTPIVSAQRKHAFLLACVHSKYHKHFELAQLFTDAQRHAHACIITSHQSEGKFSGYASLTFLDRAA